MVSFIISIISLGISVVICGILHIFLPAPIISSLGRNYYFMWIYLISFIVLCYQFSYLMRCNIKILLLFTTELGVFLISALLCIIKNMDISRLLFVDGMLFLFFVVYLPVIFLIEQTNTIPLYLVFFIFTSCLFFIIRHYKQTGKLW